MDFRFSEDQTMFQESVRALLAKTCSPERLRALCDGEGGGAGELWPALAEIGLLGLLVPEQHGGLGLGEVDLVLPLEETGRAALPAPAVESVAVAVPLLVEIGGKVAEEWLPRIARGEAIVAVGLEQSAFVVDADIASLLLLERAGELHALSPSNTALKRRPSIDPLRSLFEVAWQPKASTRVAAGAEARRLVARAFDHGALGVAAQQLGVAQQLVDMAVAYACQREQFGQPIGAFQAIKHHLANVAVRIEFARPVVYRAAYAVAHDDGARETAVSHAKAAASEAATLAAKTALQVHGAIGYTWEVDLHLWMKRAWSLELAWGSSEWHRGRIARRLLDGDLPAPSFGFSPGA